MGKVVGLDWIALYAISGHSGLQCHCAFFVYLYAERNPLKYNDPTGHCPAPGDNSGNTICVDFFIQTEDIILGQGEGDGRSFDSNSDSTKSRAYFYLHLDDQGKLLNVEPHWNTSCAFGDCFMALEEHINFEATQDADTGQIHFNWNLWNGVSSQIARTGEELYYLQAELGAVDQSSYLIQLEAGAIPAIDGELTLSPTMIPGNYDLSYVDRDPFPSLEIYHYYNGELRQTITQLPERSAIGNLGPMI